MARYFLMLIPVLLAGCVSQSYHPEPTYPPPGYRASPYPPPGAGYGPIAVARATYGTWKRGCDATGRVAQMAAGRHHAHIHADNGLCGDPHQGKDKTLNVTYYCGGIAKSASAEEGHSVNLSCP